jgi:hypothetical protein
MSTSGADDLACIDALVERFFAQFDNRDGRTPTCDALAALFATGAVIVRDDGAQCEALSVDAFARPRLQLLAGGELTDFHEWETSASTEIVGRLAARRSTYAKCGRLRGQPYEGRGHKFFHLGWFGDEWRITAIAWSDEA